jgi:hypothetical protein
MQALAEHAGECLVLYTSYGQRFATHWHVLEDLLQAERVSFTALDGAAPENKTKRGLLWELSGAKFYPQVFVWNGVDFDFVGGLEEVQELVDAGQPFARRFAPFLEGAAGSSGAAAATLAVATSALRISVATIATAATAARAFTGLLSTRLQSRAEAVAAEASTAPEPEPEVAVELQAPDAAATDRRLAREPVPAGMGLASIFARVEPDTGSLHAYPAEANALILAAVLAGAPRVQLPPLTQPDGIVAQRPELWFGAGAVLATDAQARAH